VAESQPSSRRAAALIFAAILLSRVAGLVRERVIANYLGVGVTVDAFRAASRIPNLLQNLLGEGVLSASFIPVYSRLLAEDDDEAAGRVAGAVAGLLTALAGTLVVIGVVFARPIAVAITPGFSGERLDLTVTLMRILTPGLGVLVLSAWCLGVLNSHRRFFLSYVAPVLWNGAQIAVVIAVGMRNWSNRSIAEALAWGTFAGGLLQLGVQLPAVLRLAGRIRFSLRTDLSGVRTTARRFVPAVLGRGVVQLSSYVDLVLASLLAVGAVSALGYASVLYLLPVSLFGMSVAAAELPELSRLDPAASVDVRSRLDAGLARVSFFVVPTAVAYVVAGDLVVGAVYRTGEFGGGDTRLVWFTLAAYSLGLLATTTSRLLQNALYATGDASGPARVAAARVVLAGAVGLVLMFQLDRLVLDGSAVRGLDALPAPVAPLPDDVRGRAGDGLRLGAVGLGLGATAGAWLELGLLRRRVGRTVGRVRLGGGELGRIAVAAALGGGVAFVMRLLVRDLHPLLGAPAAIAPAGVVYLAIARAMGATEAAHLVTVGARRLRPMATRRGRG
jgi:putative peptidoglycan lipid II flippase